MHASFFDELEKIALQRGGEGSRGGKVIGHTKSGDPIYAGSKGKPKSNLVRNMALGGAALGAAAILGAAALGGRGGRAASKARSAVGGFSTGGFGDKARSAATRFGRSSAGRSARRATSSSAGRSARRSASSSARSDVGAKRERYQKARDAYDKAGGSRARGQGDKWREYTEAGDDYFGDFAKGSWESVKGSEHRSHQTHKAYGKYKDARSAYEKAGGPFAQGKGETWREYTKRGDDFFGKDHKGWQRAKAEAQTKHEQARAWREHGKKSQGRTYDQGEGRSSSGGYRSDYRSSPNKAQAAYDNIPGMKGVKTKAEAKKAYRAAAVKNHPDMGGDAEKMKGINSAWDDFMSSAEYSKLAMAHWAKLASALFR